MNWKNRKWLPTSRVGCLHQEFEDGSAIANDIV